MNTQAKGHRPVWETLDTYQLIDLLSNPMMIADEDMVIRHVNEAAFQMFERIETSIQQDLPHFRARDVVGKNIDLFHKNPSYQRRLMAGMQKPHDGKFSVGGAHLGFRATPRYSDDGKTSCFFVEWRDRTAEVVAETQLAQMVSAVRMMSEAHLVGDIDVQIDVQPFDGALRSTMQLVNDMVQEHINTKKKVVACVTEMAQGNYDATLEKFNRKRAFLNDAVELIRSALKDNDHQIKRLIADIKQMNDAHDIGDIFDVISTEGFKPEFAEAAEAVNRMVNTHINTKKRVIGYMTELAKGKLDLEYPKWPRQQAFLNDAVEAVRTSLQASEAEIRRLLGDMVGMVAAHDAGDIDVFVDAGGYSPNYAKVINGVNGMVLQHIETKKKVIDCVTEFANGNFDAPLEKFPRKKAFINEAMENVRANFRSVVSDADKLARELVEGVLESRVDTSRHAGYFRTMIDTIDSIGSNFREVTGEIDRLSKSIVSGQLDVQTNPAAYKGAYRTIIESFEAAFQSLNGAFGLIGQQVQQVAVSVEQMSRSSQSLASNSQIQSSSVDEVSASAEQTDIQVKANAAAATTASELVTGASKVADEGKTKIGEMVTAMEGIRVSSQDIAKIIKVIDEIAFQTNLLALNAAVEAARAGQHGRGFAVVAQEVRNLAGRSAKAARETSDLIDDASKRVQAGVRIADETSRAFVSIADDIEKVMTLVREIATASGEQARGVAQINGAIGEIAKSALSTSQQAEELAATSAEMQAATESMLGEVSRFKLRQLRPQSAAMSLDNIPADLMAQIQGMISAQMGAGRTLATGTGPALTSDRDRRGFANF